MSAPRLSKSKYLSGLQCPKRLYLEIREGGVASAEFYRMAFEAVDAAQKVRIHTALLKYCERDTLAMVELRKAMLAKTER